MQIAASDENTREVPQPAPERTLILGWSRRGPSVVTQLDNYVPPGSAAVVVADFGPDLPEPVLAKVWPPLDKLTVTFHTGDIPSRLLLNSLDLGSFTHVVVLAYADTMSNQEADAHTLAALINLRDIADRLGHPHSIVSEMLGVRNRALAEVTRADDSVVEAAHRRGAIAIGYHVAQHANDADRGYGVFINPNKAATITFGDCDRMIVVAQSWRGIGGRRTD